MKGIIFREFLEMVEDKFGYEMVDTIIENSNLKRRGIYTSVGTYPHEEIFALVRELSKLSSIEIPELLLIYGEHVFTVFVKSYGKLIKGHKNAFDFLSRVDDTIHVEVLKLYPEAELPSVLVQKRRPNEIQLLYRSQRKLGSFAEGLLIGCFNHFNEKVMITKELTKADGSEILFKIKKV